MWLVVLFQFTESVEVNYYMFGEVCVGLTYGYILLRLAVSVELVKSHHLCYIIVIQIVFFKSVLIHMN